MSLKELQVYLVLSFAEAHYRELMQTHHYLEDMPEIGETLWYIATLRNE